MLYLIIGIVIVVFIFGEWPVHNKEKIDGGRKLMYIPTMAETILVLFFSLLTFLIMGLLLPIEDAKYIKPNSIDYEVREYRDNEYYLKTDNSCFSNIKVMYIKDGYLEEGTFDEDIVKIRLTDEVGKKAKITINKERKEEPNTFEKVFFLKGVLNSNERVSSVILTLPKDAKVTK